MTVSTTEKLANALEGLKSRETEPRRIQDLNRMIELARAGYYDNYKSPLLIPSSQLVDDLRALDLDSLISLVAEGEFDGTPEEADAWRRSDEGQRELNSLDED